MKTDPLHITGIIVLTATAILSGLKLSGANFSWWMCLMPSIILFLIICVMVATIIYKAHKK
jgi:uncharacterized membrane protein